MNPLLLGIIMIFAVLVILLGIMIYMYIKKNEGNKESLKSRESQKQDEKKSISFMNIEEDKRRENFMKSINIVHQDRTVIGTIYVNGKEEELSTEKKDNGYIYFLGNEVIGGYNPNIMGDDLILFKENTLENQLSDQIKDQIVQVISKTKRRKEQEKEREAINVRTQNRNFYEQEMGFQKGIGEERKQEKTKQLEELEKRREKDSKIRDNEIESQLKRKQEKVPEKANDINIKQEVDMNTRVTDMDTIGKRLEEAGKIKGKEKEGKLAFVESDDLDNLRDENGKRLQGHSSRYEAVMIDKKGNVKALNLENDTQEGTNPTEHNYQVKQNKNQEIKKGDVLTRLQVQGEETIGIEKGQYGEVEVYHSHDKTIGGKDVEGNKSLDKQIETKDSKNPAEGMDESTQKLSQKYQDGYRSVETSYQEAKQHENTKEEPCEDLKAEELDGNPNTVSHSHTDDIVAKLMQNGEINDKFTEREVRERVERAWDNKEEDISSEEFQKNIEEDMEQDAQNMRGERGR